MNIFTMRNGMGLATDVAQAQQFAIVIYTSYVYAYITRHGM